MSSIPAPALKGNPFEERLSSLEERVDLRTYKLVYKSRHVLQDKVFRFDGDLKNAIVRGRQHCDKMGYVFIQVRPFIVDLEHQEEKRFASGEEEF